MDRDGQRVSSLLQAAIRQKTAKIGVIGLGYVGLPLIRTFIAAGFRTLGFDVDPQKIEKLLAGQSYIEHIPASWIDQCVRDGSFAPTADMSRMAEADALLICVPTPLNKSRDPDLTYVESTAREIAVHLRPGQLVVLESTTLSRHDARRGVADPGEAGAGLGTGILPGL